MQRLATVCDWLGRIENGSLGAHAIVFSDEKNFNLRGEMGNVHSARVWVLKGRPKQGLLPEMIIREQKSFGPSVMASMAAGSKVVCDPVSIPYGTTINGPYYRDCILRSRLFPEVIAKCGSQWIWQQDNAPPHRLLGTTAFLDEKNPNWLKPWPWPARSKNLLDFYVWPALAQRVYGRKPDTIDGLQQYIYKEAVAVDMSLVRRAVANFAERIHMAKSEDGGHIKHKLM